MPRIENKVLAQRELCADNVMPGKWIELLQPYAQHLLNELESGARITGAENLLAEMAVKTKLESGFLVCIDRLQDHQLRFDALKQLAKKLNETAYETVGAFCSSVKSILVRIIEPEGADIRLEISLNYDFDGESRGYLPQMFMSMETSQDETLSYFDDIVLNKDESQSTKTRYYYGISDEPMSVSFREAKKSHVLPFAASIPEIANGNKMVNSNHRIKAGQIFAFGVLDDACNRYKAMHVALKDFNLSFLAYELAKSHEQDAKKVESQPPKLGVFTELFSMWLTEAGYTALIEDPRVYLATNEMYEDRITPDNVQQMFGGLV